MGWRDYQSNTTMELMEKKELITPKPELIPLIPFIPPNGDSENLTLKYQNQELDIWDPETWKHPILDLLIEPELEAYNGWYRVMRKGSVKYQRAALSHDVASHLAWEYLMDSIKGIILNEEDVMHRNSKEVRNG